MEILSNNPIKNWPRPLLGGTAGGFSALVFTVLHQIIISNIWFMLIPMLLAGFFSGLVLVWSFELLVPKPTWGKWLRFNLLYVSLLYLLQPISIAIYDPIMTFQEIILSSSGLPDEFVRIIMPFVLIYTLGMALLVTILYGRQWKHFWAVLLNCAMLMLLLGMNIAPWGLVYLTTGWVVLQIEQLGLILVLALVFALSYWKATGPEHAQDHTGN